MQLEALELNRQNDMVNLIWFGMEERVLINYVWPGHRNSLLCLSLSGKNTPQFLAIDMISIEICFHAISTLTPVYLLLFKYQ